MGHVPQETGCLWARRTSEIRSEVIELKVGWEGHVLPGQAHIIQFQVIGVTTGWTKAKIDPGTSRYVACFEAQSRQPRNPRLPTALYFKIQWLVF